MKKRVKKEEGKELWIGIIALMVVVVISLLVYITTKPSEVEKELSKEGYTTTNEDAFYKKIVTNNTLTDFYNDMKNEKNSAYEEYYFAKESLNFIELKMLYQDGTNSTLNITSDLRTNLIEFNYELSNKKAHLILEGNSNENYDCKIIVKNNVNDVIANDSCNLIMQEINTFLERRSELLQNEKIRELVNQPIKEYVEE